MGFLKKIFKPVQKVVQKIVPKEVRPFLPYAAAAFGPAALAGTKFATLNPAFQKALLASVTAAATDKDANILRTAALLLQLQMFCHKVYVNFHKHMVLVQQM